MAEDKKFNIDDIEIMENTIAAELTENDDIVEYIQPSSLDILKARYAAVEEDESIRNEGFDLIKKNGIKKVRPENSYYGYYSAPLSSKDEIRTDVDSPLSRVFDSTKSEFDADTASFSDISIDMAQPIQSAPVPIDAVTPVTEPEEKPKKRGRPRKIVEPENPTDTPADIPITPRKPGRPKKVVTQEVVPAPTEPVAEQIVQPQPAPTFNNRYGFDTHTRVIFLDESADDGIKVNTDNELSSAFSEFENTGRRKSFWSRKKK